MKRKRIIFFLILIVTVFSCSLQLNSRAYAIDLPSVTSNYQMFPGETTIARISMENNDAKIHTYSLKAGQLPKDFNGYFMLDGKVVDSINIPALQKDIIQFYIDTPTNPSVTEISVPIQLLREDGAKEYLTVSYTLNQDYALSISSNVQSVKAINGDSVRLEIGVTNTGNKELKDLKLQVNPPYKWILENVDPMSLNLSKGDTGLYKLNVSIPSSQQAGEYPIKVTCSNSDIKSNAVSVPVAVSTSANYFWWVACGIIILLVFTVLFFRKHGRR